MAIEPPEMQLENEGIKALQFREKNLDPNHSHAIVELLRKATLQVLSYDIDPHTWQTFATK